MVLSLLHSICHQISGNNLTTSCHLKSVHYSAVIKQCIGHRVAATNLARLLTIGNIDINLSDSQVHLLTPVWH